MWKLLTYKHTTNGNIRSIVSLNDRCVAVNEHETILDVIDLLKNDYSLANYISAISGYFYYNGYKLESTIEFNEQTHPEYFI